MIYRTRFKAAKYLKAILPLAVSLALVSVSAQATAATPGWVGTRTQATLSKLLDTNAKATRFSLNIGHHPILDAAAFSPLETSQPLRVAVSLKLRDASGLEQFNREVNQPGSANYHQYLTPAQFKERFAPTDDQVQAVVEHLKANGFTHIEVAANNMLVTADGNANSVQSGFRTAMKRFDFGGHTVYANDAAALVPASLGSIVDGVLGLQNVSTPHTFFHRVQPDAAGGNALSIGQASSSGTQQVAHKPTDFVSIYGASGLPTAANITVGIITWGDMTQTIKDLNTFTSNAGLATVNTQVVNTGTGTYAVDGAASEWALDSQTIVGISGGVKQLIFYPAPNDSKGNGPTYAALAGAFNKAVTDNAAKIINVSLGWDEGDADFAASQGSCDNAFAQAVAQGQIFSAASGDSGVYQWSNSPQNQPGYIGDYSNTFSGGTITPKINLQTYSVAYPAASPNVIAVGGTTLSTSGTTAWAGETVWNGGAAYADPSSYGFGGADTAARIWATGGGISKKEAAPAWQVSALGNSVTQRVLPDVAFDAASATGAQIVVSGQTLQIGGTSLASPIFVGLWARIESDNNNRLGFPAANFYQTFPSNPSLLHDVTSGNNGYSGYGYNAAAGWDYTTGFGSFDAGKLDAYAKAHW